MWKVGKRVAQGDRPRWGIRERADGTKSVASGHAEMIYPKQNVEVLMLLYDLSRVSSAKLFSSRPEQFPLRCDYRGCLRKSRCDLILVRHGPAIVYKSVLDMQSRKRRKREKDYCLQEHSHSHERLGVQRYLLPILITNPLQVRSPENRSNSDEQ